MAPSMREMVRFLTERVAHITQERRMQMAITPQLIAMAKQVRAMLAQYPENSPTSIYTEKQRTISKNEIFNRGSQFGQYVKMGAKRKCGEGLIYTVIVWIRNNLRHYGIFLAMMRY